MILVIISTILSVIFTSFSFIGNVAYCQDITCRDQDVGKIINTIYPDYRLFDIEELDKGVRDNFVLKYGEANPACIIGDYDGNQFDDLAMIITTDKADLPNMLFVILLQEKRGKFKERHKSDLSNYKGIVYLSMVKVGSVIASADSFDNKIEKKMTNVGIEISYYEKAKVVCFWDDISGEFRTIQTED